MQKVNIANVLLLFTLTILTLGCSGPDEPAFRSSISCSISPTFDQPIVVSISNHHEDDSASVHGELYAGKGGYEWGDVQEVASSTIGKERYISLFDRATALNVDGILSAKHPMFLDGTGWDLQVRASGMSMRLGIDSASSGTRERGLEKFVSLCVEIIEVSGLQNEFTRRSGLF